MEKIKERLYRGEEMDELLGQHVFFVESRPIGKDGVATKEGMLEESWQTEKEAFHCAWWRMREGYRVNVFRYLGASANG